MIRKKLPFIFLLSVVIISLLMNGVLYRQNQSYRNRNRTLILQNDSILSVNLELINTLNRNSRVTLLK